MHELASNARWRQTHLGRLLDLASQRFDARVLTVMAQNDELSLALANLARRGALSASHTQITRHLPLSGCGLTTLAARAGVSKQAMGKLVDQCCDWELVSRTPNPRDARSVLVDFTPAGILWLKAYQLAVQQAEAEFGTAVGIEVATVAHLGLEAYIA